MTTGRTTEEQTPSDWLRRSGPFHVVVGYREAVDLLNDVRLHTNMVSTFENLGVTSGPYWEIASASLLSVNGESHRSQRARVSSHFSPREVERVRPVAREAAHDLLSPLVPAGECDFVAQFAEPYVRRVTSQFIGFTEDEAAVYWPALELIASATEELRVLDQREQEVLDELVRYAESALEQRRRHPRADVLTLLAQEMEQGSLSDRAALGLVVTLLSAGHEPIIKQLGIMLTVLSDQAEVWDALARGELKPARVVEAVLRYRSTNQAVMRRVAEPIEYQGVRFEVGSAILISLAAANHDPRQFDEPDRFRVDETRPTHLSFGFGPHHCLGAALARIQLQEALGALTERLTCPRISDIHEIESRGLVGPQSVTVSYSARRLRGTGQSD